MTAKRVMQVVMNSSEASFPVHHSRTQPLVARRPCVRGRRSTAPLTAPFLHTGVNVCPFCGSDSVALFFFSFLKQSLAASPSVFSSSPAVLGEKRERKTESLLSQNADAGVAPLRGHGRHHLPRVDDGVVTFDTAQERVPVVPGQRVGHAENKIGHRSIRYFERTWQ